MKSLPKIILTIVVIAYIVVSFVMSEVANFNKGPDEETNLAYTDFLIVKGRLPINYDERALIGKDSNWPALYHLILAYTSRGLGIDVEGPPIIKIYWDSFRYQAIDAGGEWYYLRTEDQLRPYEGRIYVMHLGRWLSIFFGVITLLLVYRVCLEILPGKSWLALTAVSITAFIPTFTFMSSVMNEDTMMAALTTLYLWMFILVIKRPQRWWPYIVLGLALGVSITVKYTPMILPLEVIIILAVLAWYKRLGWWWGVKRIALVGGLALLASSWWFGWNFWYLNEIEKYGWLAGLLRPIFTGGPDVTLARLGYYFSGGQIGLPELPTEGREVGTLTEWIREMVLSFWGVSMNQAYAWSPWAFITVGVLVAGSGFGLFRVWRQDKSSRQWILLLTFHIAVFYILPVLRFFLSRRIGETAQGRHVLIPAIAAVVVLLVWGLVAVIPTRWQRWAFSVIVVGFMAWTGAHVYRLVKFISVPVPMRTVSQSAEWLPHLINVQFGDHVALVSYGFDPNLGPGLLGVNLAWRSLSHTSESYLLAVELVDSQGQIVTHWIGYQGKAQLPTITWDPGDAVFDRLVLPATNLPAGDYTFRVQLLSERNNQPIADAVSLPLTLYKSSGVTEIDAYTVGDSAIVLWQVDGPVKEVMPVYRYPSTIGVLTETGRSAKLVDPNGNEWLPNRSEAGFYTFVIGPRWPSGEYRVQTESPQNDSVITEPVLVVENWWKRDFEIPEEIEFPLRANFANQIYFLGYSLPQKQVEAGDAFPITLYWQSPPDGSPQANFIQFNHLLDSQGRLSGGYDRRPLEYYSTLLWARGEVIVDGYAVPVDPDASPGEYFLDVGYYITVGESAVNLPLVVDEKMTDVTSVTVGPIEVAAP